MKTTTGTLTHQDGEIQRYELVEDFSWEDLSYRYMQTTPRSVEAIARLYRANIIPKNRSLYGTMVFAHVPQDMGTLPFPRSTPAGYLYDNQVLTRYHFDRLTALGEISLEEEGLTCKDPSLQQFFDALSRAGYLSVVEGVRETVTYVPISGTFGFLSEATEEKSAVNSHFFLMDPTDIDSPYDTLATPYGFAVEMGVILQPPLFSREALVVGTNGVAKIAYPSLSSCTVQIGNHQFTEGRNGVVFYSRPEWRETPVQEGTDFVIVNRKVVALHQGGGIRVPMGGFILHSDTACEIDDTGVSYMMEEAYLFAVQVGPAAVRNHEVQRSLTCPFYQGEGTPFPSTVYPLPYEKARASRTAIGEKNGMPVVLWIEGASKNGHVPYRESSGSSLLETAEIAGMLGIADMVNMDGGGSAQIIHSSARNLLVADRDVSTNEERERPVPLAILIGMGT